MDMTTHEVEEMLSITKKTLIYYENEGLVKPAELYKTKIAIISFPMIAITSCTRSGT